MFFRLTATQESRHINGCFRTRKGRRVLNLTLIFGRPDIRTIRLTDAPMICPTGCLAKFVSSPLAKNFFAFRFGRNRNRAKSSCPTQRGVSRTSRTSGTGCDGRSGARDGRCQCGRRSRAVLTPRRWCAGALAPGIPAPSDRRVRNLIANLGRIAPRDREAVFVDGAV